MSVVDCGVGVEIAWVSVDWGAPPRPPLWIADQVRNDVTMLMRRFHPLLPCQALGQALVLCRQGRGGFGVVNRGTALWIDESWIRVWFVGVIWRRLWGVVSSIELLAQMRARSAKLQSRRVAYRRSGFRMMCHRCYEIQQGLIWRVIQ